MPTLCPLVHCVYTEEEKVTYKKVSFMSKSYKFHVKIAAGRYFLVPVCVEIFGFFYIYIHIYILFLVCFCWRHFAHKWFMSHFFSFFFFFFKHVPASEQAHVIFSDLCFGSSVFNDHDSCYQMYNILYFIRISFRPSNICCCRNTAKVQVYSQAFIYFIFFYWSYTLRLTSGFFFYTLL